MAGIIPFGAMFVYIEFASQNIAPDQLHYLYHILLIPFCILVVICSQTSIAMTYFQLHREVEITIILLIVQNPMNLYFYCFVAFSGLSMVEA